MDASAKDVQAPYVRELGDALRQFLEDRLVARAQFLQFDLRLAKGDAAMRGLPRRADQMGGVQQRLRGDATPIEADATESFLLVDAHDFLAFVRGIKSRGISAPAGAEDGYISFD